MNLVISKILHEVVHPSWNFSSSDKLHRSVNMKSKTDSKETVYVMVPIQDLFCPHIFVREKVPFGQIK